MTDDTQDTPGTTPAAEAREGLLDGLKGKAKEVVGAVTGKDDLVEEGRLQQAEAQQRKAAATDEAVADARRDDAARHLSESSQEAAAEKESVHDSADSAQRTLAYAVLLQSVRTPRTPAATRAKVTPVIDAAWANPAAAPRLVQAIMIMRVESQYTERLQAYLAQGSKPASR